MLCSVSLEGGVGVFFLIHLLKHEHCNTQHLLLLTVSQNLRASCRYYQKLPPVVV
jgi:hypothetical protein